MARTSRRRRQRDLMCDKSLTSELFVFCPILSVHVRVTVLTVRAMEIILQTFSKLAV